MKFHCLPFVTKQMSTRFAHTHSTTSVHSTNNVNMPRPLHRIPNDDSLYRVRQKFHVKCDEEGPGGKDTSKLMFMCVYKNHVYLILFPSYNSCCFISNHLMFQSKFFPRHHTHTFSQSYVSLYQLIIN